MLYDGIGKDELNGSNQVQSRETLGISGRDNMEKLTEDSMMGSENFHRLPPPKSRSNTYALNSG